MLRIASLVFISALPVAALPFGLVSGHCGSVAISRTITTPETYDNVHCDKNAVAVWGLDLLFFGEVMALKEDEKGFPAGSADVELTARLDILYELRVDRPLYVAACYDLTVLTYGDGFGTGSHSLGPWSTDTPCDLSHAVLFPANEWVPFVSRTYLHAERGAQLLLRSTWATWDLTGAPTRDFLCCSRATGISLVVPEPSSAMQLLPALLSLAFTCAVRSLRPGKWASPARGRPPSCELPVSPPPRPCRSCGA